MAIRMQVPRSKLIHMGGRSPADVLEKLFELTREQTMVMGIGNIGGFGLEFVKLLEKEGNS